MTRRTIEVRGQTYTYSPDDESPLAARMWAVVGRRVLDELVGEPPTSAITIESEWPGLTPRVAADGLVGLVGVPRNVFPALPQNTSLTIKAAGYVSHHETVTIGHNHGFPHVLLHREPIVIRGRIVRANGIGTTPVSDTTVSVTKIWRTVPPPHVVLGTLAEDANIVSLQPPLYADRGATTGLLRGIEMTPAGTPPQRLLRFARRGDKRLRLSNWSGLTPGAVIELDGANPDLLEYLPIESFVGAASSEDQPVTVELAHPLAHAHRAGAEIRRVTPETPGDSNSLAQDAIAGDTCVFLTDLAGLNTASVVEVLGGEPEAEYHRVHRFSGHSNENGYYRLPLLSRVAQLKLEATHGGRTVTRTISPAYGKRENRIDFVL